MRIGRRQRVALAIAVLSTAIGVAPLQTAAADTAGPELAMSTLDSIDVNGPAGELDFTVANPPAGDTYITLEISGGGEDHLHVTDDSGAEIPSHYVLPGGQMRIFDIGAADSDHNGVPGAPLTAGTTHLHIAADYLVSTDLFMVANLVDGLTGSPLPDDTAQASARLIVGQPLFSRSWTSPRYGTGTSLPLVVDTGFPQPAQLKLDTQMDMRTPPATTHTRWVFSAQQVADAGYTAGQLANAVQVQYSTDDTHYTPAPWIIGADGSLFVDFPPHAWATEGMSQTEYLRITTTWGLPSEFLKGAFQTLDANGLQYAGGPQELDFAHWWVPVYARPAFYGRDNQGVLWQYQGGAEPEAQAYIPRARVGGGWQAYNALTKLSMLKADGTGDLVARDGSGVLWYYRGTGNITSPFAPRARVGGGWQTYDTLVGAGDLTGDGHPDLLARDHNGVLWLYKGTGNAAAPFATRTKIGGGWQTYNSLVGAGDLTGDGHPDLLARDHNGVLWLYKGTGNAAAPFATRTKIGGGWQTYTAILGAGDLTGDSHPDLLARDHNGALWLYPRANKATTPNPFQRPFKIGTGWNTYNALT